MVDRLIAAFSFADYVCTTADIWSTLITGSEVSLTDTQQL